MSKKIVCGIDFQEMREILLRYSESMLNKAENVVRVFEILRI